MARYETKMEEGAGSVTVTNRGVRFVMEAGAGADATGAAEARERAMAVA